MDDEDSSEQDDDLEVETAPAEEEPRPTRRRDPQWLALGVAIVIGAAGLVYTNIQTGQQDDQIAQQERALEQQRREIDLQRETLDQTAEQLALSRGLLETSAVVNILDPETQRWGVTGSFNSQRLSYESFADRVYIILTATNVGLSTAYVDEAGVLTGDETIAHGTVLCQTPDPTDTGLTPCAYPVLIEAQASTDFYIRVDEVTASLECNDFVRERGLTGAVKGAVIGLASAATTTYEPFSNDCVGPIEAPED